MNERLTTAVRLALDEALHYETRRKAAADYNDAIAAGAVPLTHEGRTLYGLAVSVHKRKTRVNAVFRAPPKR